MTVLEEGCDAKISRTTFDTRKTGVVDDIIGDATGNDHSGVSPCRHPWSWTPNGCDRAVAKRIAWQGMS
jgi:hypothetical protein